MILANHGIISSSGGALSYDADAQAVINAIEGTGTVLTTNDKFACNKLIVDLKNYGVWNKTKALYGFLGGTASAHKFNWKDPRDLDAAYRLVSTGGVTHSNLGVLTNGTTGYIYTNIYPNVDLTSNDNHLSIYSNLELTDSMTDVGLIAGSNDGFYTQRFHMAISNNNTGSGGNSGNVSAGVGITESTKLGHYIMTRTASNSMKFVKNGSVVNTNTTTNSTPLPSFQMYLGAWNVGGNYRPANRRMATVTIGSGLSDAESVALHNAVHTFNTTLGRNY